VLRTLTTSLSLARISSEYLQRRRQKYDHLVRQADTELPPALLANNPSRTTAIETEDWQASTHRFNDRVAAGVMQAGVKKAIGLCIGLQHLIAQQGTAELHTIRNAQALSFSL